MSNAGSEIWMITGGGRSGKSAYAEKIAAEFCKEDCPGVLYIATGVATDEEMEERIAHHKRTRPEKWVTWEENQEFSGIGDEFNPDDFQVVMLDCVGNMVMGILYEQINDPDSFSGKDFDEVERIAIEEIGILYEYARRHGMRLIFVTNEIGMGVIPPTKYSRYFRDSLGRINKYIAEISDRAVLMVAGLPLELK
jgi:adenosylcobinamide kinase/adenosylcobinamide-phosphate guanylyltransferase